MFSWERMRNRVKKRVGNLWNVVGRRKTFAVTEKIPEICCICIEELNEDDGDHADIITYPCGHKFHARCAQHWNASPCNSNRRCPYRCHQDDEIDSDNESDSTSTFLERSAVIEVLENTMAILNEVFERTNADLHSLDMTRVPLATGDVGPASSVQIDLPGSRITVCRARTFCLMLHIAESTSVLAFCRR